MTYYINVYDVGSAYGGPEEGGWWYDTGEFIKTIGTAATLEEARALRNNVAEVMSRSTAYRMGHGEHDGVDANGDADDSFLILGGVWGEGSIEAHVEEHPGRNYPTERPRYE